MKRKLQHSMGALTTSAAVFGLLLLAGGPAAPDQPSPGMQAPGALIVAVDDAAEAPATALPVDKTGELPAADHVRRSHRATLAMPYFSFGDTGLRRVTGS